MIKAKRLEALEADTITAWHAAWEQSAETFYSHMDGLTISSADFLQGLKTELPDLTDDDVERKCRAFLQTIGVTQSDVFSTWFSSYELPDLDADRPNLTMWPSDVPKPPDELPGEWARVLPYRTSEDLIERLAAQVYLFILAAARTAREGRGTA